MIRARERGDRGPFGRYELLYRSSAATGPMCTLDRPSSRFASRMPLVSAPSA